MARMEEESNNPWLRLAGFQNDGTLFSKSNKGKPLKKSLWNRMLWKKWVSIRVNPMRQTTWEKMQNLFLPWTSGIPGTTPDNPGDESRNCKESPDMTLELCSKESSNCSLGGMRAIVKFIGLNRDRQSVRVLTPQKACVLLNWVKVEAPRSFFDAQSQADRILEPRVMRNEKE